MSTLAKPTLIVATLLVITFVETLVVATLLVITFVETLVVATLLIKTFVETLVVATLLIITFVETLVVATLWGTTATVCVHLWKIKVMTLVTQIMRTYVITKQSKRTILAI